MLVRLYTEHLREKKDGRPLSSQHKVLPPPAVTCSTVHVSSTSAAQAPLVVESRGCAGQTAAKNSTVLSDSRDDTQILVVVVSGLPEIVFQLLALSGLCPDRPLQLGTLRVRQYFGIRDVPLEAPTPRSPWPTCPNATPGFTLLQVLQLLGVLIDMVLLLRIFTPPNPPTFARTQTVAFLHNFSRVHHSPDRLIDVSRSGRRPFISWHIKHIVNAPLLRNLVPKLPGIQLRAQPLSRLKNSSLPEVRS